jgi:hypothetical protein
MVSWHTKEYKKKTNFYYPALLLSMTNRAKLVSGIQIFIGQKKKTKIYMEGQ